MRNAKTVRGPRLLALGCVLALAASLAACGSSDSGGDGAAAKTTGPTAPAGTLTVSAAASLTAAFTEIGRGFEAANPGTAVRFNFGSSGTLAAQIEDGAPADVAALAATGPMDDLDSKNLVHGSPVIFVRNTLVIVTKPGNPLGIGGLADLTDAAVVSLCVPAAPCGSYADRILADAGVTLDADEVTRGQDVKATLAAVTQGDADAAIVYVTDAKAAGSDVATVTIPDDQNAIAEYPMARLAASTEAELADAFMAYVRSAPGTTVLTDAGFLRP